MSVVTDVKKRYMRRRRKNFKSLRNRNTKTNRKERFSKIFFNKRNM